MRAQSELIKEFDQAGFTLVRQNNHVTWRCPCGHTIVTVPSSPGKGRAVANTRALMVRTLRACTPQQQRSAA